MKNRSLASIIVALAVVGLSYGNDNNIIINLDMLKDTELFSSMIFNVPKTIILETSKKCLIGSVTDMQVYDEKIYIFDKMSAQSLLQFDLNGKFIRKIADRGKGPGEYLNLSDFTIDKKNSELYLLDNNKLHRYKTDGTYINSVSIEIEFAGVRAIQFYKGMIYAEVSPYSTNNNDIDLIWIINPETGKKIDSFLKLSQNIYGWNETISLGHKHFFACLNEYPIYAHYLMNSFVSLEDMTPKIKLESKNLPKKRDIDEILREKDIHSRIDKLLIMNKIFCIHNYIETQNFVFFSYLNGASKCGSIFHDYSTNKTHNLKFLRNDLLWKKEAIMTKFSFYDSVGAYQILDAYHVFDEIKKNNIVNNIDKNEQLHFINEESNPVIFYYEFKEKK